MGVLTRLIRSFVVAFDVLDGERYADSRLCPGARQDVDALVSSLQRHAVFQIKDLNEIGLAQRRLLGYRLWNAEGADGDVGVTC